MIELKMEHVTSRAYKTGLVGKVSAWLKKKANGSGARKVFWHYGKPYIAFEYVGMAMFFKMAHW